MTTTLNIADIKRYGKLDAYAAHAIEQIAKIESAALIEDGDYVAYAGLGGEIGYVANEGPARITARIFGGLWDDEWYIGAFASDKAAEAYAKAALRNQLKRLAAKRLARHRADLAALKAAR